MNQRSRKLKLAFIVGLCISLLVTNASIAYATDEADGVMPSQLIAEVSSSDDPFALLDSMSDTDQKKFIDELEKMNEDERDEVFIQTSSASSKRSAYTDIAWSTLEKAACVVHVDLISCNRAAAAASTASSSAAKLFSASSLHNGKGDAYRHCYWNALMVIKIGSNGAMKIASNHEQIRNGPAREKKMDLANNKTGRKVGKSKATASKSGAECRRLANNGSLITLK